MLRLLVSVILVVAFAGASSASVAHGLNHGSDHAGHHPEMTENDLLADAENALADCCDTTSGMGASACFGELAAISAVLPDSPASGMAIGLPYIDFDFANLTLSVPTGPPKA